MERTEKEIAIIAFLREHFNLCDDAIAHSVRVSDLAKAFARQEGVDSKANLIAVAALLHELRDYDHNCL
jgi:HD superfamily phosphodiesterase